MSFPTEDDPLIGDEAHLERLLAAFEADEHVGEWDDRLALANALREAGLDAEAERIESGLDIDVDVATTAVRSSLEP